MVPEFNVRKT